MNERLESNLKAGAIIAALFAAVVFLTITLHWFVSPLSEAKLKTAVAETLKEGGFADIIPGDPVPVSNASGAYSHAWAALTGKTRTGTLYAVRVTGMAGPWPAVFICSTGGETDFAGIIGRPDSIASPIKYGLTPRVIESWIIRLERFESQKGEGQ